eukprot:scaffold12326_cov74-Phaeocystis_antarctica.AAC.1
MPRRRLSEGIGHGVGAEVSFASPWYNSNGAPPGWRWCMQAGCRAGAQQRLGRRFRRWPARVLAHLALQLDGHQREWHRTQRAWFAALRATGRALQRITRRPVHGGGLIPSARSVSGRSRPE